MTITDTLVTRPYRESDEAQVIALWQACGLVVPQNDPARDIARKLQVGRELFLVACEGDEVVASVMGGYEGHRGWINYLAVKPSHRRRGYGEAMMQQVELKLRALGCPKINLQVRSSNREVIDFYRAIGYGEDRVVGLGKRLEQDRSEG